MKSSLALFLVFTCFLVQYGSAQFVRTVGPLNTLRANHESQTLLDGTILAFGGQNNGVLKSSELFDPATETWTERGDMMQARTQFASVVLNDGKVLAIGGSDGNGETNTCELFDPVSGSWSFTGSLSVNTSFPSAVKLPDGRVLMTYQTTAEVYDPDSAAWFPVPSPSTFRNNLILLGNGKVLHLGIFTTAELYDPLTNSWSPTANDLSSDVTGAEGVSLLGDGRVLITGGGSVGRADIYDPVSNMFSPAQNLLIGLSFNSTVSMNNGNVLAFGISASTDANDTQTIQVYNGQDDQWYSLGTYAFYGPSRSSLHVLGGGSVLSVGGSARLGGLEPNCYFISSRVASVSIDDPAYGLDVVLSPNPVKDLLHIELDRVAEGEFQLMDIQGKIVSKHPLFALHTQLSVAHLPRGMYFYRIQQNHTRLGSGKILLR